MTVTLGGVATYRLDPHDMLEIEPEPEPTMDPHGRAWSGSVLPLLLAGRGSTVLHASGVVGAGGGLAIAAPSGTGKTTLAASLERRGWARFADDAVWIHLTDAGGVEARTLPIDPVHHSDMAADSRVPLAAVVMLRRGERPLPTLERLRGTAVVTALLAESYSFDGDDLHVVRPAMDQWLAIAERVPVWELTFEPDLERLDELAEAALSLVARPSDAAPTPP